MTEDWQSGARKGPQDLADDRPPDARQPGESTEAYRAWLSYLEHGNIRAAADALNLSRQALERYSRRWKWPARAQLVLAGHVRRWSPLIEYESRHGLGAVEDGDYLAERELEAMNEINQPSVEEELRRALEDFK